jgi:hypothetical protein
MITILVGDVSEYLATHALALDADAKLISQNNFNNITPGTYYTALGDFADIKSFTIALSVADTLVYCPPDIWSDSVMKKWTEFYLQFFSSRILVHGLDKIKKNQNIQSMLHLVDSRKTNQAQLWVAGCSCTIGVGVTDDQRYGQLISNRLNMPVSFLAESGSSIPWAADQILRSDIRTGDIVIWGLTQSERFPFYHNHKVEHISAADYPKFSKIMPLDRIDDDNQYYSVLTSIHQVLNFCNKLNVKLVLAGIMVHYDFISYLSELPNFIQFCHAQTVKNNSYLDYGTDQRHPGPKTHAWYAAEILHRRCWNQQ